MVCFESKIVQWSNLAFIYGPCSLGDAILACSELFKWGKSFSSSHPFVRSAPKLISLSPTCHRLPPLLTPNQPYLPPSASKRLPRKSFSDLIFALGSIQSRVCACSAPAWYQSWDNFLCISRPLPNIIMLKFVQDFKACWIFCFVWTKVVESIRVLNPLGPLCLWQFF